MPCSSKFKIAAKNCNFNYLYLPLISPTVFPDPANVGLALRVISPAHLETKMGNPYFEVIFWHLCIF